MKAKNKIIAVLAAALLASLAVNAYAAMVGIYTFRNRGTLSVDLEIKAYLDADCTILANDVEWGHVELNVEQLKTTWVKNENTVPVTISAIATNWNPSNLSDHIEFRAVPYSTPQLVAGEVKELDLYLTVYSTYTGPDDFTFDIVVQAAEIAPF